MIVLDYNSENKTNIYELMWYAYYNWTNGREEEVLPFGWFPINKLEGMKEI